MAHCKNYLELSEVERNIYDTSLLHVCRNSDVLFEAGKKIIERGRKKKLFNHTIIRPVGDEVLDNNPENIIEKPVS